MSQSSKTVTVLYAIVLVAGTALVLTGCLFLVQTWGVLSEGQDFTAEAAETSRRAAGLITRLLVIELAVLIVASVAAVALDRFHSRRQR